MTWQRRKPKAKNRIGLILLACLFVSAVVGTVAYHKGRVVLHRAVARSWPAPAMDFRAARASYPYSVIPGGAYEWKDVADSVKHDPVVRRHYDDVRVNNLWAGRTQKAELLYVSYRKDDRVYWTRNKVRVPAGELVLTDGNNVIRARCGNRLRKLPPPLGGTATPGEDPPELIFQTPVPPITEPPPELQASLVSQTRFEPLSPVAPAPSVVRPPQTPIVPIIPIIPPVSPPEKPGKPPVNPPGPPPTPEPGTLVLFLSGMGFLGGAVSRRIGSTKNKR